MNITITVSPKSLRRLLVAVTTGIVVGTASIAFAELPQQFKDGDELTAGTLSANFTDLDTRLAGVDAKAGTLATQATALESRATALETGVGGLDTRLKAVETKPALDPKKPILQANGGQYSMFATYAGTSVAKTSGKITRGTKAGYEAAKLLCEDALAPSKSVHMCTNEEIMRSAQLAIPMPAGWYAAAVNAGEKDALNQSVNDCYGWTATAYVPDPSKDTFGLIWSGGPSDAACDEPHLILCCD